MRGYESSAPTRRLGRMPPLPVPRYYPAGAPSELPACGGGLCTAEDRFGLVQQLLAVLMQRAILPGQLSRRIPRKFPAALVKILAFLYQFLARVDQVIRGFFSF